MAEKSKKPEGEGGEKSWLKIIGKVIGGGAFLAIVYIAGFWFSYPYLMSPDNNVQIFRADVNSPDQNFVPGISYGQIKINYKKTDSPAAASSAQSLWEPIAQWIYNPKAHIVLSFKQEADEPSLRCLENGRPYPIQDREYILSENGRVNRKGENDCKTPFFPVRSKDGLNVSVWSQFKVIVKPNIFDLLGMEDLGEKISKEISRDFDPVKIAELRFLTADYAVKAESDLTSQRIEFPVPGFKGESVGTIFVSTRTVENILFPGNEDPYEIPNLIAGYQRAIERAERIIELIKDRFKNKRTDSQIQKLSQHVREMGNYVEGYVVPTEDFDQAVIDSKFDPDCNTNMKALMEDHHLNLYDAGTIVYLLHSLTPSFQRFLIIPAEKYPCGSKDLEEVLGIRAPFYQDSIFRDREGNTKYIPPSQIEVSEKLKEIARQFYDDYISKKGDKTFSSILENANDVVWFDYQPESIKRNISKQGLAIWASDSIASHFGCYRFYSRNDEPSLQALSEFGFPKLFRIVVVFDEKMKIKRFIFKDAKPEDIKDIYGAGVHDKFKNDTSCRLFIDPVRDAYIQGMNKFPELPEAPSARKPH